MIFAYAIETHHSLHYALVLLFYNLGLAANILMAAHIASQSKISGISSIAHYLKLRCVPVGIRWFLCICLFLIVWGNPSVLDIERFMPNFSAHLGIAGGLGFLSDALWDKVLAIVLPGLQKELPPIPDANAE